MFRALKRLVYIWSWELGQFLEELLHWEDPAVKMENQLRLMYGRGEIPRDRYKQLRFKLSWNLIGQGDILLLQQDAARRMQAQGQFPAHRRNADIDRSLDRLYLDKVLLEEARAELEERQAALAAEARWLGEQAESAYQSAQSALPDEIIARHYLEIWQHLVELRGASEQKIQLIAQELRKVNALEADVRASVSGLKLIESQEYLDGLRLAVRQNLLKR